MVKVRKLGNRPILPSSNNFLAKDELPANCFAVEIKSIRSLEEMTWSLAIPEFTFWKNAKEHTVVTQRMTMRKPKSSNPLESKHLTQSQIKKLLRKLDRKMAIATFANRLRPVTQDQLVKECEDKLKKRALTKARKSKAASAVKNRFGEVETLFDMWA